MSRLRAGDRPGMVHLPCVTAPHTATATLPRDHPCSTVLAAYWVFGKEHSLPPEMSSKSQVDASAKVQKEKAKQKIYIYTVYLTLKKKN